MAKSCESQEEPWNDNIYNGEVMMNQMTSATKMHYLMIKNYVLIYSV